MSRHSTEILVYHLPQAQGRTTRYRGQDPAKLKLTTQEVFAALAHSNKTDSQEIKIATFRIVSIVPDAPIPTPITSTINATADLAVGENDTFTVTGKRQLAPRSIANGAKLRILCLGASITTGYLSTDGNGYRYGLRSKLVQGGNVVNMVGSLAVASLAVVAPYYRKTTRRAIIKAQHNVYP
ncbi:hypothetical protein V493_02376 [Pseudogymnoascus sp. VKM F-4281 (FW-2241)]|nr:hypothetical protein V493_02376 [Pseudogymnoascus sp. VKM F-4281 (FW-2241)]